MLSLKTMLYLKKWNVEIFLIITYDVNQIRKQFQSSFSFVSNNSMFERLNFVYFIFYR